MDSPTPVPCRATQRVDRPILFLNLFLLMTVSLCSFSTAVVSDWILSEREAVVAAALYGGVFALMGLGATAIWAYAVVRRDFVPAYARPERVHASIVRAGAGCLVYL